MNLTKKLGIDTQSIGFIGLGSNSGVGKTTLYCIVAGEYMVDNKRVLYLTDEMDKQYIIRRLTEIMESNKIDPSLIRVERYTDLKEIMGKCFENDSFDVVIVDGGIYKLGTNNYESVNKSLNYLRDFSFKNKCLILSNIKTHRNFNQNENDLSSMGNFAQKADMIMHLTRKDKFSFWQTVKYFLCFWLKKPNRELSILKNRYGKEAKFLFHFDWLKLKIS